MKIGSKLATLRNNKHLTQEQMSELLEVKRARYNAWENDISKPDLDMIKKIAEFHKVSVDYLLDVNIKNEVLTDQMENLHDFKIFMASNEPIVFNGVLMSEEAKHKILGFVESMFWDDKANKRKH